MSAVLGAAASFADRLLGRVPLVPADVRRQRRSLDYTDHRPWPLPARPWMMGQTWRDLLFAHWAVDAAVLGRVVPPRLPLDTFDGDAWIGVTPFVVTGFRMRGTPPAPIVSSFPELNVRTYVMVDGKPGIYFLSLDADSRVAVAGARRSHRLPYFRAHMTARRSGTEVRYASERVSTDGPPAGFQATYRGPGAEYEPAPGTLDHWLTERYCLYTLDEQQRILRADIHHRPWRVRLAEAEIARNTMTAAFGIEVADDPLLHLSARQDTLLWGLARA